MAFHDSLCHYKASTGEEAEQQLLYAEFLPDQLLKLVTPEQFPGTGVFILQSLEFTELTWSPFH